jgi:uncharacterized membrane protein
MFDIAYEPDNGLITCTISGFLKPEDVQEHAILMEKALRQARRQHPHVRILMLICELAVQSREVTEEGNRLRRGALALNPEDRMAYVLSSSRLSRLQTKRSLAQEQARTFLSEPEARAWLLEG